MAVFPSYAEAFAIAPLEAMAWGCPTIYSQRGSGPELIRHGDDGWLVDPDQTSDLSQAISRLLKDDVLANRLGTQGRRRIEERFTWIASFPKMKPGTANVLNGLKNDERLLAYPRQLVINVAYY